MSVYQAVDNLLRGNANEPWIRVKDMRGIPKVQWVKAEEKKKEITLILSNRETLLQSIGCYID